SLSSRCESWSTPLPSRTIIVPEWFGAPLFLRIQGASTPHHQHNFLFVNYLTRNCILVESQPDRPNPLSSARRETDLPDDRWLFRSCGLFLCARRFSVRDIRLLTCPIVTPTARATGGLDWRIRDWRAL